MTRPHAPVKPAAVAAVTVLPHPTQRRTIVSKSLRLSSALPDDKRINGLDALADKLAGDPHAVVCAIVWFDVAKVESAPVPTVRIRRVEPLGSPTEVLLEVRDERARQDAKWGEQNHPDGTGTETLPLYGIASGHLRADQIAENARESCQWEASTEGATWRGILLEEVFEALACDDSAELRGELIQVAAVCVSWVEAIDRRTPDVIAARSDHA